ncbi:hypothetical protein P6166_07030 [Stenotrophomonas sp. HITSZ_GD]|uniref:hypothetical protein n=1 Tax=Stenotrophomonas sp. HITSZ_GD TaxID=3037248 RepID=UPI00240DC303|nr:hypothetical protein [Stenotrophomonas sp. HITSZ_GD]MDG2525107.1 hypothetical protein [Stenotrophomonas sp. HITSZ_GD]
MNTVFATPPPLPVPPRPAAPPPRRHRFGIPGWLIALIVAVLLLFVLAGGLIAWGIGSGWKIFAGQAQQALQAQPAVQEHIGTIQDMHVDLVATGHAVGAEEFVFRLDGDRGDGKVLANFVSVGAAREIITEGVLTLDNGARYELEDQSATDEEDACPPDDCGDDSLEDT